MPLIQPTLHLRCQALEMVIERDSFNPRRDRRILEEEERLVIKIPTLHVLLPGAKQDVVTTIPLLRGLRGDDGDEGGPPVLLALLSYHRDKAGARDGTSEAMRVAIDNVRNRNLLSYASKHRISCWCNTTSEAVTDLPAYSDTVYSDTLLTVALLACHK